MRRTEKLRFVLTLISLNRVKRKLIKSMREYDKQGEYEKATGVHHAILIVQEEIDQCLS